MIRLTAEQRQELGGQEPARAIDPQTNETYVLVRSEVYERLKNVFIDCDETFVRDMYPHVMEVFGRGGCDDPAMDVYDDLDPRRAS